MGLATVAMAVTASSAFPGFFPPLELTGLDVGTTSGEFDRQAYTDGAVFDNLGVRMYRWLQRLVLADSKLSPDDFFDFPEVLETLWKASVSETESPLRRLAQLLVSGARRPELPQLNGGPPSGGPATGATPAARGGDPLPAAVGELRQIQPYTVPAPDAQPGNGVEWLLSRLSHVLRYYQLDRDPVFAALTPSDPDAAAFLAAGQIDHRTLTEEDQVWLNRHLLDTAFRQATGHRCFRRLNSGLDGVLVSDVGKPFEVQSAQNAGGLIRTAMRASDILMDRVWQLEIETFADTPGFVFAPVTDVVEPAEDSTAMHTEIQRQVANIRTDFDRFSDLEISSLVRHGYCVGRKACRSRPELFGADLPSSPPWDPIPGSRGAAPSTSRAMRSDGPPREPTAATAEARSLQASAGRRIWGTLLDRRDWTSYIYVPIIVPILIMLPYFTVKYYQRSHKINQLLNSLSQGRPELDEMSRLMDNGPEPRWIGMPAEEVSKLDEPNTTGFDIIQDSWITDLRLWKPRDSEKPDPNSRLHHFRRLLISMKPDYTGSTIFRWPLLARDPNAAFKFPEQRLQPRLRKWLDAEASDAGGKRLCNWEASFDLRNVPAGDLVDLLIEYQSAGMFLQQSGNTVTVPLNVRQDTAELTVWILMPEGKQYTDFHIVRYPKAKSEKVEPVKIVTRYLSTDYTILAFKLLNLDAGYNYEVIWTHK
jgi:hypothetical protein